MDLLDKVFRCCEKDKTKKSDVTLDKYIKRESGSNLEYLSSTKNTQNLPSLSNYPTKLILSFSSKGQNLDRSDIKTYDKEKQSSKFIKNLQSTLKLPENDKNNFKKLNLKKKINLRSSQTIGYKIADESKNVITISDMSFYSEDNEQKEDFSKLLLTGDLFFGKEIIINDCGMVSSKRNKKDGYTVFGLNNSVDISGQLNSDFVINFKKDTDEIGKIETKSGKVFEIKFNKERKEYTLYFINPYLYLY